MKPDTTAYDLALFYYGIARRDCIKASKDKSCYNRTTREIQAGVALDAKQDLERERMKLWKTH